MFSALKKLFGKSAAAEAAPPLTVLPPPTADASPPYASVDQNETPFPEPEIIPRSPDPNALILPLNLMIPLIPREFYGRLALAGVAGFNFTISKARVLEQLPHGSVKVPFGDLRRFAPPDVFTNSQAHDAQPVELPLKFLLRQLRPEDYSARAARPRLEAPAEIADVFSTKGDGTTTVHILDKKQTPAAPPVFQPRSLKPAPTVPMPPNVVPLTAPVRGPASPAALRMPGPVAAPPPPPAQANKPFPATSSAPTSVFLMALEELAVGWPEAIRQEIAQLKIPFVKCALPPPEICDGLKRGKIQYSWEQLRSAIHPAPPQGPPSPYAETMLDLPLNIVTPLFLDFIRSTSGNRKLIDASNITEFFRRAGLASPYSAAPPTHAPAAPIPATPALSALAAQSPLPVQPEAAKPSTSFDTSYRTATPGLLSLPISLISHTWPEPVQHELARLNLTRARLEIPFGAIEPSLRRGKIEYLWSQICPWLQPCPPEAHHSPFAEARLSFPLSVVAPLFLKQKHGTAQTRKADVPKNIPDLFGPTAGATPAVSKTRSQAPAPPVQNVSRASRLVKSLTTAPPAPPVAAPKPAVRLTSPPAEIPPAAPAPPQPPANLAELFGEPDKKKWTPNDIVHKTVQLPGVKGALIALQDGLLVASCLPPGVKSETIGAFLPQIIGRMSQYAKEFQMGALKSVTLKVENSTMQIYNPGVIYYAVLGGPDTPLPADKLDFIAAELSRGGK